MALAALVAAVDTATFVAPQQPFVSMGRRRRRARPAAVTAAALTLVVACAGGLIHPAFMVGLPSSLTASSSGNSGAAAAAAAGAAPCGGAAATWALLGLGGLGLSLRGLGRAGRGLASSSTSPRRRTPTARRAADAGSGDLEEIVPFEIRGFSLSQLTLGLGIALVAWFFVDFFYLGGASGSGFGALLIIYAVPILLLGLALLYAEIPPVEVETQPGAEGIFDQKSTQTLRKIVKDVTRHRYGDFAHLDTSLKALGLVVPQGKFPQLKRIILGKAEDGELEFTMLFESKDVPYTMWSNPGKLPAMDRFFGPGLWSDVSKYSAEEKIAAVKLTTGPRPADKELPGPAFEEKKLAA